MRRHPEVPHPADAEPAPGRADRVVDWLGNNVLASRVMFSVAFVAPLIVLPMSDTAKLILAVISGSWIQWWALPALQRSQMRADAKRAAKADADHQALSHIAHKVDEIHEHLRGQ